MELKVVIARVTTQISSDIGRICEEFKELIKKNRGVLLSNSFSSIGHCDGFTMVLSFADSKSVDAIYSHQITNADVRLITEKDTHVLIDSLGDEVSSVRYTQ